MYVLEGSDRRFFFVAVFVPAVSSGVRWVSTAREATAVDGFWCEGTLVEGWRVSDAVTFAGGIEAQRGTPARGRRPPASVRPRYMHRTIYVHTVFDALLFCPVLGVTDGR